MATNSITKDVFTINYNGSFDETVSVNCSPADWSSPEAKQNTITISGKGITKTISLKRKALSGFNYTDWANKVRSKWGVENFKFPNVGYSMSSTQTQVKFPIDKYWSHTKGNDAIETKTTNGRYMDMGNMSLVSGANAQRPFSNFLIDEVKPDTIINGCWCFCIWKKGIGDSNKTILEYDNSLGAFNIKLYINDIDVHIASGNPTIDELESYLANLGWGISIALNNQNNRVTLIPLTTSRIRLYIKMVVADSIPSNTLNVVLV